MKIIFLDFDGVLNSHQSWKDGFCDSRGIAALSPKHVDRLNSIINNTEAVCVISSTWRELHSQEEIDNFLTKAGFTGKVIGQTPVGGTCRAEEISEWLRRNKGRIGNDCSFIVLDDNPLCEFDTECETHSADLKDRFIQTDWMDGLQNHHVRTAIDMLGRKE